MDGAKPKRNRMLTALLAFGFVGLMLGGLAGAKQAFGAKPGEHCNQTDDLFTCKWGGVCIGRTCYASCSKDSDCPSNWHCGTTDVTVTTQRTFGTDKHDGTEKICFAPKVQASTK